MNDTATKGQEVTVAPQKREIMPVFDAVPLFDTASFDHLLRISQRMARSSMLPQHLQVFRRESGELCKPSEGQFDYEGTVGNCLAVCNTARAWEMDPMEVAESMSMINGKRCYEGKLIAALIERKLGVRLVYEWTFDAEGNATAIKITHPNKPEEWVEGDLAGWKTDKWGSNRKEYRKRLKYRGDREWCRMWAPALVLALYGDDEMEEMRQDAAARRATPVASGVLARLPGAQLAGGFSRDAVVASVDTGRSESRTVMTVVDADGTIGETILAKGETVDTKTGEILSGEVGAADKPATGEASSGAAASTTGGAAAQSTVIEDRGRSTLPADVAEAGSSAASTPAAPAVTDPDVEQRRAHGEAALEGRPAGDGKLTPSQSSGGEAMNSSGATQTTETKTDKPAEEPKATQSEAKAEGGGPQPAGNERQTDTSSLGLPLDQPVQPAVDWPAMLPKFSAALGRGESDKSLKTLQAEFWAKEKIAPPVKETPEHKKMVAIYEAHLRRVKKQDTAPQCQEKIKEIIWG